VSPCSYLTSHHSEKHIGQQNYEKTLYSVTQSFFNQSANGETL
jgi:hypothetical protein